MTNKTQLLICLACLAATLGAQSPSPGGSPELRVLVPHAAPAILRVQLEALGYDVSHADTASTGTGLTVFASQSEYQTLLAAGFELTILEQAQPLATKLAGEAVPPGYRDLATIVSTLQSLATQNPGLISIVDIASVYGPGATIEGRPILAAKISDNVGVDEDEPNVLFASCHHSREIVTPEIAMEIILHLVNDYGTDPIVTGWVDQNEIWVIPVMNPDGLEYVWTTNNMWRKNRKIFPTGEGVDLNRNYPFGWDTSCGGSTSVTTSTYRGPSAGSEEETQSLLGLLRARHFAKVVDYHSSGREVRRRYSCLPMPSDFDTANVDQAAQLALVGGYAAAPSCCLGGHIHQQMAENTAYTVLIETHTAFQPTHASALTEIQTYVMPMVTETLNTPIPITGIVTDAATGTPLQADITVQGDDWLNGEFRTSDPVFGRYHLWLPAGTYTLTFSAPGYPASSAVVTVSSGTTTVLNHALTPLALSFHMTLSTTGGGTRDLDLELFNIPAPVTEGFTLLSLDTSMPLGQGTVLGIRADSLTLACLTSPAGAANLFHWIPPFIPGLFPANAFVLGPGTVPAFVAELDAQAVALGPGLQILGFTSPLRVTF